ncbi:hypothetical protein C8R43DRAFT_1235795 [Mycena crocata]|nr:hypothetical protein C8R43DRAFT_1235795 [Mycena crocata]
MRPSRPFTARPLHSPSKPFFLRPLHTGRRFKPLPPRTNSESLTNLYFNIRSISAFLHLKSDSSRCCAFRSAVVVDLVHKHAATSQNVNFAIRRDIQSLQFRVQTQTIVPSRRSELKSSVDSEGANYRSLISGRVALHSKLCSSLRYKPLDTSSLNASYDFVLLPHFGFITMAKLLFDLRLGPTDDKPSRKTPLRGRLTLKWFNPTVHNLVGGVSTCDALTIVDSTSSWASKHCSVGVPSMRTRSEVLTSLASQTQFKTTFNSRVWFNFEEWWTVERRMVLLRAYNSDRTCYNHESCVRQHREYGWIVSATGCIYDVQWMINAHLTLLQVRSQVVVTSM